MSNSFFRRLRARLVWAMVLSFAFASWSAASEAHQADHLGSSRAGVASASAVRLGGDDDDQGMHTRPLARGDDDDDDFSIQAQQDWGDDDDGVNILASGPRGDDDDDGGNIFTCRRHGDDSG